MKRLISLFAVMLILVSCLVVAASAAVYTEVFEHQFLYDYETFLTDSNGCVDFLYNTGAMGIRPGAYSGMDMPTGGIGRVFAFIACQNYEARSTNSSQVVNNYVSCQIVLQGSSYATKTQHVATRGANGVSNGWDYTYVSPAHDDPTNR